MKPEKKIERQNNKLREIIEAIEEVEEDVVVVKSKAIMNSYVLEDALGRARQLVYSMMRF